MTRESLTICTCDICGKDRKIGNVYKNFKTSKVIRLFQGTEHDTSLVVSIYPYMTMCQNPDICKECLKEYKNVIVNHINEVID